MRSKTGREKNAYFLGWRRSKADRLFAQSKLSACDNEKALSRTACRNLKLAHACSCTSKLKCSALKHTYMSAGAGAATASSLVIAPPVSQITPVVVITQPLPTSCLCFLFYFVLSLLLCCLFPFQGFVLFGWVFRLSPPGSHEASSSSSSQIPLIVLGAVSGLAGSILDSLMGAILQGSYYDE